MKFLYWTKVGQTLYALATHKWQHVLILSCFCLKFVTTNTTKYPSFFKSYINSTNFADNLCSFRAPLKRVSPWWNRLPLKWYVRRILFWKYCKAWSFKKFKLVSAIAKCMVEKYLQLVYFASYIKRCLIIFVDWLSIPYLQLTFPQSRFNLLQHGQIVLGFNHVKAWNCFDMGDFHLTEFKTAEAVFEVFAAVLSVG